MVVRRRRGALHRLGWAPSAQRRDTRTGPVVCGRAPYRHSFFERPPTRYCSFDPTTLTLSPLDFLEGHTSPVGIDVDGRVWTQTIPESVHGVHNYKLSWTDDDGATWHRHPIGGDSRCTEGGQLVACTDGGAVQLSLDRGMTWSSMPVTKWLARLPGPRHMVDPQLWQVLATRSGSLVADVAAARYGSVHRVVRRPPGRSSDVRLTPVSLTKEPAGEDKLTNAAGLLVANDPVAPSAHRPGGGPPIWLSYDQGRSWKRVQLHP